MTTAEQENQAIGWRYFSTNKQLEIPLIDYINQRIQENPKIKIIVGTDSIFSKGKAQYNVSIAFVDEGHGATCVYKKSEEILYSFYNKKPKGEKREKMTKPAIRERLKRETDLSLEVADYLENNGIAVDGIELDYNTNANFKSEEVVKECIGLCVGHGYKNVKVKPYAISAVAFANEKLLK